MRPVHVILAVSLAANAVAVVLWTRGATPRPSDAESAATPVAEASPPPVAPTPLVPAAGELAPAPASVPVIPVDRVLGRAATDAERREYAEFLRGREAAGADAFAALVAQRERRSRDEAEAARIAELDARHGGPIEFLTKHVAGGGPAIPEFVRGGEFDRWFVPHTSGATVPVRSNEKNPEVIRDGDVLHFAAGAHRFYTSRWRSKPFPQDLVFEGEGRDATIVTFDEFDTPSTPILGLTFRDMTVDCGNEYLVNDRGKGGTVVRLERCRLIRFDIGAGASVAFSTEALAIRLTDCIVETGFGRSPTSGAMFRCAGPILGRIDRTTLRGVEAGRGAAGSVVVLDGCTVDRQRSSLGDWQADWIRSDASTTFAQAPTDATSEKARATPRALTEINPGWKDVK